MVTVSVSKLGSFDPYHKL